MIYRYTILYVADVPASLKFYDAAFGLQTGFLHETGYGELQTGPTKLAFSSHAMMASIGKQVATEPPDKPAFELAFEVADVTASLARAVKAGAVLVTPVTQMPWGQTLAYVRTPDGTLVELCTAVAG